MSNVSFAIGGRRFTVACAAGEETHVADLGRAIDMRVAALGGLAGQSETRMLLFAALTLADEVHEHGVRADAADAARGAEASARLQRVAALLENLADRLERAGAGD